MSADLPGIRLSYGPYREQLMKAARGFVPADGVERTAWAARYNETARSVRTAYGDELYVLAELGLAAVLDAMDAEKDTGEIRSSPKVRHDATDTSRKAARHVAPKVGTQRHELLKLLLYYRGGLTDWDMRDLLRKGGQTISYGQTARRLELEEGGYIRRTDRRRANPESGQEMIVFEITDKGLEALREARETR